MSRTVATREYLISKGFAEDRYSFIKNEFILMKTTVDMFYEVWNDGEVVKTIPRCVEDIEIIYKECTNNVL